MSVGGTAGNLSWKQKSQNSNLFNTGENILATQIARHWRLNAQRYGLVGDACPDCNRKVFPPRDVCPHCAEEAELPFQFSCQEETNPYSTIHLDGRVRGILRQQASIPATKIMSLFPLRLPSDVVRKSYPTLP